MELTLKQKTAFGIGAVGKDMVYALSASYVMYYYQDVLGLSASFVGLVLMAARFFDAFNDPFMGVLVAKTRTRWGRFRPWIFSGTLLNALVLYALFAAPVLDEAALMVYFSVVYILWGVTYTMMDIPFGAVPYLQLHHLFLQIRPWWCRLESHLHPVFHRGRCGADSWHDGALPLAAQKVQQYAGVSPEPCAGTVRLRHAAGVLPDRAFP